MVNESIPTTEQNESILDTLLNYEKLGRNVKNHYELLKNKTLILYIATLLENKNLDIIDLCLDIIDNFVQNDKTHKALIDTFGIYEALESLAIRSRSNDLRLSEKATRIIEKLRETAPPAYCTRLRKDIENRRGTFRNVTSIFHLHIPELTTINRTDLDELLVSIRGIVSFVVDMEKARCTIRITPKLSIQTIVSKILEECNLTALVVKKDKGKAETYIDVLNEKFRECMLEDSYNMDNSPRKSQSSVFYYTQTFAKNTGGFFKSAADFWNKSFYW